VFGESKSDGMEEVSLGRMPESVVAHLVKAFWEDVLKESAHEFEGGERLCSGTSSGSVLILEGYLASLNVDNPVVGNGDAMDVSA